MSQPLFGSVTTELYEWMLPLAYADERYGWALLRLCATLAEPLQPVDDIVRGTDDRPGWGVLFSVTDAPGWTLPYLAQAVGTPLAAGLSEEQQRAEIADHAHFRRGTRAAIIAAAQRHLIGAKTVKLYERDGDPYHFRVVTYAAMTPDADQTEADILAAKPAGLTFDHEVRVGQTWGDLRDGEGGRTWQEVVDGFDDWDDVLSAIPL